MNKYIVESTSIFDGSVLRFGFDDLQEARSKVRELKDAGSNYFIVKLIELEPANK
tara:strand:- start:288 stop:452 length:165 start_codon:yes stop_codon:yes gene_type:complete